MLRNWPHSTRRRPTLPTRNRKKIRRSALLLTLPQRTFLRTPTHTHRDPRTQEEARSLPASEKIFTLAVSGNRIVVGTSDRSVLIYDVRCVSFLLLL